MKLILKSQYSKAGFSSPAAYLHSLSARSTVNITPEKYYKRVLNNALSSWSKLSPIWEKLHCHLTPQRGIFVILFSHGFPPHSRTPTLLPTCIWEIFFRHIHQTPHFSSTTPWLHWGLYRTYGGITSWQSSPSWSGEHQLDKISCRSHEHADKGEE